MTGRIAIVVAASILSIAVSASMLNATEPPGYGRIDERLLECVVKITAHPTAILPETTGTGFLVSAEASNSGGRAIFLVTNKHMVGDWNPADRDLKNKFSSLQISFYERNPDGTVKVSPEAVPLVNAEGAYLPWVILHPDPAVDIAAIRLTDCLSATRLTGLSSFDMLTYLMPYDRIAKWFVGLGDQVFALGYPFGISAIENSYPIAKSGYLSTPPGRVFSLDFKSPNRLKEVVNVRLTGKLLLVDGLIVPGNSGGPLVMASELKVRRTAVNDQLEFSTKQSLNNVLGIVSIGLGGSGLTIVYSADYIRELLPTPPSPADAK